MREEIKAVILYDEHATDLSVLIPQLCIELHCLPSALKNEDYNDVENIIMVLNYRGKKQERLINKNKK